MHGLQLTIRRVVSFNKTPLQKKEHQMDRYPILTPLLNNGLIYSRVFMESTAVCYKSVYYKHRKINLLYNNLRK